MQSMRHFFGKDGKPPRCVVMAGGRSSRFQSVGTHKSMAIVKGMPVIHHVIDYWRNLTDDFVFVVKNGKDQLIDFVRTLPIRSEFVEPSALRGIADGLSFAEEKVDGPFVVVLGDCFCAGRFEFPDRLVYGIGVQQNAQADEIRRNYAVCVRDGRVASVVEKPVDIRNDLCGMGFYFFQPDVFDYIRMTGPSRRTGEREITDVLQTLVDHGVELQAVPFNGTYINVNTPEDLERIAAAL